MAAYDDYSMGGFSATDYEDEEERKRRLAAEQAQAQDQESGGITALRPDSGFSSIPGRYLNRKLNEASTRVSDAAEMFTNPEAYAKRRFGMAEQPAPETVAPTPVKQTITTDPETGEQKMKIEGSVRDLSAANPMTPTVTGPAVPTVERETTQPAPVVQQQQMPPAPVQQQQMPPAPVQQPVAPATMPTATAEGRAGEAQAQAAMAPPAGVPAPINPNAPAVTPTGQTVVGAPVPAPSLAQAGAQAQVAGTAALEAPAEPAWVTAANAAGSDFGKLLDVAATHPESRGAIQAKLQNIVENKRKEDEAAKIIKDAQAGDLKAINKFEQAIRPTKGKEREEVTTSDYLKAYMYARLGLNDLSAEVQAKISGKDTKFGQVQLGGSNWQVETNAKTGEIIRAKDDEGNIATANTINKLAAAGISGKGQMYTGGSKIYSIPKDDPDAGQEYTSKFNNHSGNFENIITTGPNRGKAYTGAPGLEKRVETAAAIISDKQEASKGLIDYRLQQNLKYAGPLAYTRAGAQYVGRYNAENNTSLGYNRQGVLVDHNNDNKPVEQNKDGTIAAVQRVEKTSAGTTIPNNAAAATTNGAPDLTKPPAYDSSMSPRENQKAQDNWAAVQKKTRQDFTTGPQGKTVTAMNTAVAHLDTLNEAGTALYGGQVPVANKVVREFANQLGLPEYTNFEGIKHIVGTEVAKAVSGSGQTALADRQAIEKEFDSSNSPDQLKGIIKKYQELMGGQLKSQKQTWTSAGLHPQEFESKLLPRTKKVINETEAPSRSKW